MLAASVISSALAASAQFETGLGRVAAGLLGITCHHLGPGVMTGQSHTSPGMVNSPELSRNWPQPSMSPTYLIAADPCVG